MLKTRIAATFIILFAFIFTYLYAIPLPRDVGDEVVATFTKLDGSFLLNQTKYDPDGYVFTLYGEFNQGFDVNDTTLYFIVAPALGLAEKNSFKNLQIPINPPKAGPWGQWGTGDISTAINTTFTVYKQDNELDTTTFVKLRNEF
ncbi:hypothetical protein F8M41_025844 [Gigaspora margarita]|uniref:Uncharacterized protein n=1 Tax=Gigaspora margarita TaxID=4874 RepID=A0A8H3XJV7_GIGMA|nr:hypothetical protein F8M41_025844 [Gigaspora margarita]